MKTANGNNSVRTAVLCALALLIGFGPGWYFAHKEGKRQLREAVDLMTDSGETSDAWMAALSVQAINDILAAKTNHAIWTLSAAVERFYSNPGIDERRRKLRTRIEDLIRTNSVAANAIREHMDAGN